MNVLIGTTEIGGLIPTYAEGFRRLGHKVTTVIQYRHRFIDYDYDVDLFDLGRLKFNKGGKNPISDLARRAVNKVAFKKPESVQGWLTKHLIDTHDLFIFLNGGNSLFPGQTDLPLIQSKGKQLVSIFAGTDVRHYSAFGQEFHMDTSDWDKDFLTRPVNRPMTNLRNGELYSSMVLSVPDQSGLAVRPYNHFQIPIDLKVFQYHVPGRDVPVILHAPTRDWIKGTDTILGTLDQLKGEGFEFELRHIKGVPHKDMPAFLSDADILVDELILHGPGILSFEAMASGCAVATRYLESSPSCFRPPVVNLNKDNIYEQLKALLSDKPRRIELAKAGRQYLEQHNATEVVAQGIIDQLQEVAKGQHQYYPSFYLNGYQLPQGDAVSSENKVATLKVIERHGIAPTANLPQAASRGLIDPVPTEIQSTLNIWDA